MWNGTECIIHPAKYKYTSDMGEISGFGGEYEEACRNMVIAGLEWLDMHPNADPKFHGYAGIYGIIDEDNNDAKELGKVVENACDGCSGAMYQVSISHILYIKNNGWDKYVDRMRMREGSKS